MSEPVLLLQHVDCEPGAAYEDELGARGLSLRRVRMDLGEELPDWRSYAAIVAMGGPMGTYDEDRYDWLAPEKRLIADAVRAGKPYWGVCLGAQLLAASLGARVARGPAPEVGVAAVALTEHAAADPVFSLAPPSFPSLHWHGDTYELPPHAVHLARSKRYEQQAFRFENAYALQFHLEVPTELLARWGAVPAYADSLPRSLGNDPLGTLLEQASAVEAESIALARTLFGRWLERIVGLHARA